MEKIIGDVKQYSDEKFVVSEIVERPVLSKRFVEKVLSVVQKYYRRPTAPFTFVFCGLDCVYASGSASNTAKTTDFDSVTTVLTPEEDVQVETKLEIPVKDNKEDVKSEAKSPKVKKSSEAFSKI